MDHHQASITKNLKMLVHKVYKYQFYGIPFTFINSLYKYHLLDVLLVVSCAEILYMSTMNVLPYFFSLIGNLEVLKLSKLVIVLII